jgi:hypothetical protein
MRRDIFLSSNDDWYVRFPDGQVLHAPNTNTVRQYIDRGRIPLASTVRRSAEEEWVILAWTAEFADLVKHGNGVSAARDPGRQRRRPKPHPADNGASISAGTRLDPRRLHTVGVRSFVPELLAALENTVMRQKLVVIAVSGMLLGGLFALAQYPLPDLGPSRLWYNAVLGVLAGLVAAATSALLTRTTFVELSRLRPAKEEEVRAGWTARTVRLFVAQLLVAGFAIGLIVLLRGLPQWLLAGADQPPAWQYAANAAAAVGVVGQVVLWPVVVLTLLLAPIMVVEEASVESGLTQWWQLFRQHPGSVLLYELLAVAIGLVVALVPALPLLFLGQPADDRLTLAVATTRNVLWGLPAALLFAYVTVANVFIYLHLRYESPVAQQ